MLTVRELLSRTRDPNIYIYENKTSDLEGDQQQGAAFGYTATQDPYQKNKDIVKRVLDDIRQTEGLGEKSYGLAQRTFDKIITTKKILTRRQISEVVAQVVHTIQPRLPDEEAQKFLLELAEVLQKKSLHLISLKDFNPELALLRPEQITSFIEQHIEIHESTTKPTPTEFTQKINEAREDLEKLKDHFGGAPNYPDGKPCYTSSSKKFFGIPIESCRAWCQKILDKQWFPLFFWKALGKAFGLSNTTPETPFEKHCLYLESMKRLSEQKENIAEAFQKSVQEGKTLFTTTTRLACHPDQNGGSKGMTLNINSMLELFSLQYENAKKTNTLEDFFSHVATGVCFEDRFSILTEYAMKHPPATEDGTTPLDLTKIIDHSNSDDILNALIKEMEVLNTDNPDAPYGTWENIRKHLIETMVGLEREQVDDSGTPLGTRGVIIEADIDRLREAINNVLLFED